MYKAIPFFESLHIILFGVLHFVKYKYTVAFSLQWECNGCATVPMPILDIWLDLQNLLIILATAPLNQLVYSQIMKEIELKQKKKTQQRMTHDIGYSTMLRNNSDWHI